MHIKHPAGEPNGSTATSIYFLWIVSTIWRLVPISPEPGGKLTPKAVAVAGAFVLSYCPIRVMVILPNSNLFLLNDSLVSTMANDGLFHWMLIVPAGLSVQV